MTGAIPPAEKKAALRESCRIALNSMTLEQHRQGSELLCRTLAESDLWRSARTVMMFAPIAGEPNLKPLALDVLKRGRLCLPRVDWIQKRMAAAQISDLTQSLILRRNNILEPRPECPEIPPGEIDLILVPGLGFDRSGVRLGRGGGFYDRYLAQPEVRAIRCGVLFDCQLVDAVPAEPHDVRVGWLATPGELRKT